MKARTMKVPVMTRVDDSSLYIIALIPEEPSESGVTVQVRVVSSTTRVHARNSSGGAAILT